MSLFYLVPLFLAFAYRIRGMYHAGWGTTVNRIVAWALPVGLVCALLAHVWGFSLWLAALSALLAWAGSCIGHGSFQNDDPASFRHMGLYCVALLGLILLPFMLDLSWAFHVDGIPLHRRVAFCLMVPVGYLGAFASWLGYRMHVGLRTFGIQWCVPGDSSWEEFYIGAFAFGIPLAALGLLA